MAGMTNLETDLYAVIFDHNGYCVTKSGGFFHVWQGAPSESASQMSLPAAIGTLGVKHCIESYELGCIDGGRKRADLIRRMLEKVL